MNMPSSSAFRIGITKPQSGFTLLELVLVLFIVALIATTPLLFIDNQDNQIRYDETLQKMQMIRDAIIQRQEYRNQPVLSGFVIDNGVLPPSIDGSLDSLTNFANSSSWVDANTWQKFEAVTPYFNFGSAEKLDDGFAINKGYRKNYITKGLDSDGLLKDGWGNDFVVSSGLPAPNTYQIGFISSEDLVKNRLISIEETDWLISPKDLNIRLLNNSSTSEAVSVAVLIFKNSTDTANPDSRWESFHYNVTIDAPLQDASGAIIQYAEHHSKLVNNWFKNDVSISAAIPSIPAGEHLIILNPATSSTPSDTPHDFVRVIPGSTQPTVTLLVSPE